MLMCMVGMVRGPCIVRGSDEGLPDEGECMVRGLMGPPGLGPNGPP